MSKSSRRRALLQPSTFFLLLLAGIAGLVIAGLAISRAQSASVDTSTVAHDDAPLRFAALAESDRKALLGIEVAAASTATRLDGTSDDRAQATERLSSIAQSVEALGAGVPMGMRRHIAAKIEQAHDAARQGNTQQAILILRELSNRMASGRSA